MSSLNQAQSSGFCKLENVTLGDLLNVAKQSSANLALANAKTSALPRPPRQHKKLTRCIVCPHHFLCPFPPACISLDDPAETQCLHRTMFLHKELSLIVQDVKQLSAFEILEHLRQGLGALGQVMFLKFPRSHIQ